MSYNQDFNEFVLAQATTPGEDLYTETSVQKSGGFFTRAGQNLRENNGVVITLFGILFVFCGLLIIFAVVKVLNNLFSTLFNKQLKEEQAEAAKMREDKDAELAGICSQNMEDIPEEHVVAIATAIELYRRLHFENVKSEFTFVHGKETLNGWRLGQRYGIRN